ncbi:DUF7471 family protein [Halorarum salinum]|uniref:Uncharacterized protein n=1 Tax=Halorarum salinum TaxID=2743089 RepID=A0A7D5QCI2_9EURY|nr:hypothetical protein [Halobaculum salinum]QLG61541.1 hypothetical protein HUG12_07295 [Halobaculum salinum]
MGPSTRTLQLGADWIDPGYSPLLTATILLAGLGTTMLFLVSVVAYRQRRTSRYLLVAVALAALVVRTGIGLGTMLGFVPMTVHHLASHSLDFLIAAAILYAVYRSGPDVETLPAE